MAKQKVTGARVEYWKNKKGEFNYHIVGRNGRVLAQVTQGFKTKRGLTKNISALADYFCRIDWDKIIELKK